MRASPNTTAREQVFATDTGRVLETLVADLRGAAERLSRKRDASNEKILDDQVASVVGGASRLATLVEHAGKQPLRPEPAGEHAFATDAARALQSVVADLRGAVERLRRARPADSDELVDAQLTSVVGRASRLASQLLAYAGKQSLRPERLELLPFLSDFGSRLRHALDRRIDVSVDVAPDCPACFVDAGALEDALLNLVANARDAMAEGGGRLWLAAAGESAPDGSPTVAVSVSDDGRGMTTDFLQRALRPFVTTKTDDPRSGLGLPATDGFARQSGGRLSLRSREGGGVAATLTLPQGQSRTAAD